MGFKGFSGSKDYESQLQPLLSIVPLVLRWNMKVKGSEEPQGSGDPGPEISSGS